MPTFEFGTVPQYLQAMSGYPNLCWIYRGQADASWPLLPKAGRPEYFLPSINTEWVEGLTTRDISRFRHWRELAIAYNRELPTNDLECLAFAQHYGLATRLLDWSTNPLVALFFAVDSCSPEQGAVYCYAADGHIDSKSHDIECAQYLGQYSPPPFDSRILMQSGVFTYHPEPNVPLLPGPVGNHLHDLRPEHGVNLIRFQVMDGLKPILKRQLDEIGVNRKSLFPDLDGLSEFINWGTKRALDAEQNDEG